MIVQILVEDSLQEVYDSPGAKLAIETAVHREFMKLRDAYYDKLSRQSVLSRGFIGVEKK
jgi:hypothetical protein